MTFPIAAIVVVVLLLGVFSFVRRRAWVVVYEGAELSEQASDQYGLLQANGIRCRMRIAPLRGGAAANGFAAGAAGEAPMQTIVEVHKDDAAQAKELLRSEVGAGSELLL